MSCYGNYHGALTGYKQPIDPNYELEKMVPYLQGITRKIIKGLCKQYRIISVSQEPDNYCENNSGQKFIVKRMPIVVQYQNWETNDPHFRPFEWEFNEHDLNITLL